MIDFSAVFQFPAFLFPSEANVIISTMEWIETKIFPTDLLLLTQVISSGVVRIAWHRKVYRKMITTKYSLNNWGIRSQFSSHTLYLQTSRVLRFLD